MTSEDLKKIKNGEVDKKGRLIFHKENLRLGKNIDIGGFTILQAKHGIEIGDNVQIGGGCKIYSWNSINDVCGGVVIKDNATIGANSVILPNTIIGKNAHVRALTLVNIDVEDDTTF